MSQLLSKINKMKSGILYSIILIFYTTYLVKLGDLSEGYLNHYQLVAISIVGIILCGLYMLYIKLKINYYIEISDLMAVKRDYFTKKQLRNLLKITEVDSILTLLLYGVVVPNILLYSVMEFDFLSSDSILYAIVRCVLSFTIIGVLIVSIQKAYRIYSRYPQKKLTLIKTNSIALDTLIILLKKSDKETFFKKINTLETKMDFLLTVKLYVVNLQANLSPASYSEVDLILSKYLNVLEYDLHELTTKGDISELSLDNYYTILNHIYDIDLSNENEEKDTQISNLVELF